MKTLAFTFSVAAVAVAAGALVACYPDNWKEDSATSTDNVVTVDPIEGAYVKQGGTPLQAIFKRDDGKSAGTFIGEIATAAGKSQRVEGTFSVGEDNLGTTLKLTPDDLKPSSAPRTAETDGGAPAEDSRTLAEKAFSGTMHYLKIGKNNTILIRGEQTAHYKKVASWCRTDDDCKSDVQNTGLTCAAAKCNTSKNACACE